MFAEVIADRFPVELGISGIDVSFGRGIFGGGDEERANQQAAIALAINPDNMDAILRLHSFLASRQRHSWAIAEYRQGIQQAPLESEVGVRMRILLGEIFMI